MYMYVCVYIYISIYFSLSLYIYHNVICTPRRQFYNLHLTKLVLRVHEGTMHHLCITSDLRTAQGALPTAPTDTAESPLTAVQAMFCYSITALSHRSCSCLDWALYVLLCFRVIMPLALVHAHLIMYARGFLTGSRTF